MICLGQPQLSPDQTMALAAQLYAYTGFRDFFVKYHPGGIVISELEYLGKSRVPFGPTRGLSIPSNPAQDKMMKAFQQDFRNWVKPFDYRKCDAMGLSADGIQAELLEVTTGDNKPAAEQQLIDKLNILNNSVAKIHNSQFRAYASSWKPRSLQKFREYKQDENEITYICFQPTYRLKAPPGVVLYEMHRVQLKNVTVPVPAPAGAAKRLQQVVPAGSGSQDPAAPAKQLLGANPDIRQWILTLLGVCALAVVIAAIIILLAPAAAALLAAFAFAAALVEAVAA